MSTVTKTIPGNNSLQKWWERVKPANWWTQEVLVRNLPYILFLCVLFIIYIRHTHVTENTIRDIEALKKQEKQLLTEYLSLQTELNQITKQTQIIETAKAMGLQKSRTPHKVIVAD